jgi:signal transduction histidine kinase
MGNVGNVKSHIIYVLRLSSASRYLESVLNIAETYPMKRIFEPPKSLAAASEKRLNILVHADTYTLQGDFHIGEKREPLGTIADLAGIPITFNYLIDIDDTNNLVHPEDIGHIEQLLLDLKSGQDVAYNFRIITPSGQIQPISGNGTLTEINRNPIADFDDITSREELQLKIFEHAELVSDSCNWTWNLDTNEFNFTSNAYRIFSLEPASDASGFKQFRQYIHPEDLQKVLGAIETMKQSRVDVDLDFRIVLPNNEIRYLTNKAEVFTTHQGIQYFIGTTRDTTRETLAENKNKEDHAFVGATMSIHDQLKGEKKLKDTKELLEAIFNSSTNGIAVLQSVYNEQGELTDFEWRIYNVVLQKLAGGEGLTNKKLQEKFSGVMESGLFSKLKAVVETSIPQQFEIHYNFDGLDNWYDIAAVKLEDCVVVTFQDISTRKQYELQLQHVNESLSQKNHELSIINEELSTFAFVASHDLREPLRKVEIFSKLLLEREVDNMSEAGKDFFKRITAAIGRMNSLINDILTYSRASGGPRELNDVDLNDILEDVISDLSERIKEKQAVIEHQQLPRMKCNAPQMGQLFQNLISNALKFQPLDQVPVIKITSAIVSGKDVNHPRASSKKKYLRIEVTDNGIGFNQEYTNKIFQMFQRLHGMAEFSGTGMGLAICKKIVENHKGFISAQSKEGKGSTFCCYFSADLIATH